MPGNYIQIGGKKRTVKFDESKVKRDEQGRFAKKGSGNKAKQKLTGGKTGASIKAIPGESKANQIKRARKAADKFSRAMKKERKTRSAGRITY